MNRLEKREDADIADANEWPWGSSSRLSRVPSIKSPKFCDIGGATVGVFVAGAPKCAEPCVGSPGMDSKVIVLALSITMLLLSSASELVPVLSSYDPLIRACYYLCSSLCSLSQCEGFTPIDVWNMRTSRSARGKGAGIFTFLHDVSKEKDDAWRVGRLSFGNHVQHNKKKGATPKIYRYCI